MPDDRIAARGNWGIVAWAVDAREAMPASAFIRSKQLVPSEKRKAWALLSYLSEIGERLAFQSQKFKKLGHKAPGEAKDLFELRPSDQIRFLGEFREGREFVVAVGLRKKRDDLRVEDMQRAIRTLSEDRARS